MCFSFVVFLFLCVRASYKNRQSVSFSLVVVDRSNKITCMWEVSINSTKTEEPTILAPLLNSQDTSVCYWPCFLLPPTCLLFHAISAVCPMKIREWQHVRRNGGNMEVEEEIANFQFCAIIAAAVLKNGEKTSYFYFSVAPCGLTPASN